MLLPIPKTKTFKLIEEKRHVLNHMMMVIEREDINCSPGPLQIYGDQIPFFSAPGVTVGCLPAFHHYSLKSILGNTVLLHHCEMRGMKKGEQVGQRKIGSWI